MKAPWSSLLVQPLNAVQANMVTLHLGDAATISGVPLTEQLGFCGIEFSLWPLFMTPGSAFPHFPSPLPYLAYLGTYYQDLASTVKI